MTIDKKAQKTVGFNPIQLSLYYVVCFRISCRHKKDCGYAQYENYNPRQHSKFFSESSTYLPETNLNEEKPKVEVPLYAPLQRNHYDEWHKNQLNNPKKTLTDYNPLENSIQHSYLQTQKFEKG